MSVYSLFMVSIRTICHACAVCKTVLYCLNESYNQGRPKHYIWSSKDNKHISCINTVFCFVSRSVVIKSTLFIVTTAAQSL